MTYRKGIIASFGGGKGGIGKSLMADNIAYVLAKHSDKRVLLVNMNPSRYSRACFDFYPNPANTISRFMHDRVSSGNFSDILIMSAPCFFNYDTKTRKTSRGIRLDAPNVLHIMGKTGKNMNDAEYQTEYNNCMFEKLLRETSGKISAEDMNRAVNNKTSIIRR